jgi:hypothetical protein
MTGTTCTYFCARRLPFMLEWTLALLVPLSRRYHESFYNPEPTVTSNNISPRIAPLQEKVVDGHLASDRSDDPSRNDRLMRDGFRSQ